MEGRGKLISRDNQDFYYGDFKNGLFHGYGKHIISGKCILEGEWKNGELHG
jgi:hypothetical protein